MKYLKIVFILLAIGLTALIGYYVVRNVFRPARFLKVMQWLRDPQSHPEWSVSAGDRCGDAPFLIPTNGMIGFLWGDSFRIGHSHQGIDIFSGTESGLTPVFAAYSGYLTRLDDWKSSLIIRIPKDPLHPDQQIWTYYTHLADQAGNSYISDKFPPGSHEIFIKEGTLLGYQGNFSGTPDNPTGVHLHFSIVKDDGKGNFLNELDIHNTLDPSPYFGLDLNARSNTDTIPLCPPEPAP